MSNFVAQTWTASAIKSYCYISIYRPLPLSYKTKCRWLLPKISDIKPLPHNPGLVKP